MPTLGKIERSLSAERAGQIEWDNYQRERKGYYINQREKRVPCQILVKIDKLCLSLAGYSGS